MNLLNVNEFLDKCKSMASNAVNVVKSNVLPMMPEASELSPETASVIKCISSVAMPSNYLLESENYSKSVPMFKLNDGSVISYCKDSSSVERVYVSGKEGRCVFCGWLTLSNNKLLKKINELAQEYAFEKINMSDLCKRAVQILSQSANPEFVLKSAKDKTQETIGKSLSNASDEVIRNRFSRRNIIYEENGWSVEKVEDSKEYQLIGLTEKKIFLATSGEKLLEITLENILEIGAL